MYARLLKYVADKSFFLLGPRGTGKTSWLKKTFPEAVYIDLLKSELYFDLKAYPSRLENMIAPDFKDWIILDEVQRIPELLNEVHRLIEEKHFKFVLTGSSARSLRKKGVNLLAGRALTYKMYPLTAQELKQDFSLEHALQWGLLPSTFSEKEPEKYLSAYIDTYLREEVLQEGLTRNVGAFARFLEVASFSQGNVLNVSEIAREAGINRKVTISYFEILEDLLIATRLNVFTKRAVRRMVQHPKFYFFDAGIYQAIRPKGPLDRPEEAQGAALETLVFQELKALNDYLELGYEIFFWRTNNQEEVDFVLYGPRGILAFEVKRAGNFSLHDLSGLRSFGRDYPEAKRYLLYGGKRKEYHEGIEIIPVEEAIRNFPALL